MGKALIRFVLDNSVAMRWRFRGQPAAMAYAERVGKAMDAGAVALVPTLWHIEAANVILREQSKGRIDEAGVFEFLTRLRAQEIITVGELQSLFDGRVLLLAREHGLTAYDAVYLDLALREGLPLATNDEALATAAKAAGVPLYLGGYGA